MLRCTASFIIAAYFYVRRIPQDFFASGEYAQSQPFGPGPGLCALPANFLRNHHNFDFLHVHQQLSIKNSFLTARQERLFLFYLRLEV
jgi:hypothetical protein